MNFFKSFTLSFPYNKADMYTGYNTFILAHLSPIKSGQWVTFDGSHIGRIFKKNGFFFVLPLLDEPLQIFNTRFSNLVQRNSLNFRRRVTSKMMWQLSLNFRGQSHVYHSRPS